MDKGNKKILAFLLSRSGCVPYATQMINHSRGIEIKVYSSAFSTETLPKDSYRIPTYRNKVEFILSSCIILPWLIARVLMDIRKGYSIAYFPVFHPWNPFLILAFRLKKGKSIVTIHESGLHLGEHHFWEQWLLGLSMRWGNQLIFLSQHERDTALKQINFRGRNHVIPHAVLPLPGLKAAGRILPARPALLFLGRIVKYKGIELLLEAVSRLPEDIFSHLTIAGAPNYQIKAGFSSEKIRWELGWLSEEKMARLLNEHDILVLPYLEASQSGILTLGISAGIPMACTRVGALVEQLGEEEAVWANPEAESILAALLELLQNPSLYGKLHQNLIKKSRQDSWEKSARQLESVIMMM